MSDINNFVSLIPERSGLNGPVTALKLRKTLMNYLLIVFIGLALSFVGSGFWSVFGLGLMLPGGGFLGYLSGGFLQIVVQLTLFFLTVGLFVVGLFLWFASGNIVAPILVWLGAAAGAGAMHHLPRWEGGPWLIVGFLSLVYIRNLITSKKALKEAKENKKRRNAHLVSLNSSNVISEALTNNKSKPPVTEMSEKMLGFLRYSLDRALQPADSLEGFDVIDQFQTSSVRYQICYMGYSLAQANNENTPAFRGYLSQAQRNLHEKMLIHKNWAYWALENAWGNLKFNRDPIPKDNIMYTGWYSAMLLEYISNTGDKRYENAPIIWKHPSGKRYEYTLKNIIEIIHRQYNESDFCLWPCEPNWIYTLCNNYGIIALSLYDRLYGTDYWASIKDRYKLSFESEFVTYDGRVLGIRSSRTGLTISSLTSVMADSVTAYNLHGVLPDFARRCWEVSRLDYLTINNGEIDLKTRGWDLIDIGNYKKSSIFTLTSVAAAAAEMGDSEVASLIRNKIESEFKFLEKDGMISIPSVSNLANISMMQVYGTSPDSKIWLHAKGMPEERKTGPLLLDAPYPDVMVALANNDNRQLDLVLRPGCPAALGNDFDLSFGQLDPQRVYCCEGLMTDRIVADSKGEAKAKVKLNGRHVVKLSPEMS